MRRYVGVFAILLFAVISCAHAAEEIRPLGCKGALNDGDILTGLATYSTSSYWDSPGGRRVYWCNASHLPFSADNTVTLDDLYPLASAGNWKTFYTDGSGVLQPLAIGASGDVLTSNGASSAPSWEVPSGGGTIASTPFVLKGDGSGNAIAATLGTDYVAPSGTVSYATSLAANPSDCSAGEFAIGIDASGNLTCDTPSGTGDMLKSVYDTGANNIVDSAEALSAQYIDWNASSGATSIANKPSLGTMATQAASAVDISGGTGIFSSLTMGSVSNTEIGYLDGVTSAIQTQIDAKRALTNGTFTIEVVAPQFTSSAGDGERGIDVENSTDPTGSYLGGGMMWFNGTSDKIKQRSHDNTATYEVFTSDVAKFSKCFTAMGVDDTFDFAIEKFPYAVTITNIKVYQDGATNVIGGLDECTGTNGVCSSTTAVDSDITGTDGAEVADDGSLSNPGIAAGNYIRWHTTSVSGTNTRMTVCFFYTADAVN
jgi:hypothetical protein